MADELEERVARLLPGVDRAVVAYEQREVDASRLPRRPIENTVDLPPALGLEPDAEPLSDNLGRYVRDVMRSSRLNGFLICSKKYRRKISPARKCRRSASNRLGTVGAADRSTMRAGRSRWNSPTVQASMSASAKRTSSIAVSASSAP